MKPKGKQDMKNNFSPEQEVTISKESITVTEKTSFVKKLHSVWFDYTESLRTHKTLFLLWSFLLPMGIMALIYVALGVYPVGNNSVLVLDLNGQYVYFFEELRSKILSGESLLYSWSRSLGGEFIGIFAYYLASPFSFIVCLFPKSHITEALLTIILLKVGSCGLTMSIFLKNVLPSKKIHTVIFSTLYAVCSYAVVQAHNTMWIDEMIFLPLLALGIQQLICKRKFILYTIMLAMSMMSNFYIGYMMCIFSVIYFFYYYVSHSCNGENNFYGERYHFIKSLLRIILFSAVAAAIAMVILYPAYISLTFGKTTFTDPKYTFNAKFDFLDMLAKLFPGSYDTVRPEGLPFIYCGTLTLIMLPFYFISKKIRAREKFMGGLLILTFVISFMGSTVDIIWHGFQNPNWLNYRYSFMLVFVMLSFAYQAFDEIAAIKYHHIITVCGGLLLLLFVIQKQDYEWLSDIGCIWLSVGCIAAYLGVLYVVKHGWLRYGAGLLLAVIVSLELFLSGLSDEIDLDDDVVYSSRTSYVSYMDKLQPAVDALKAYDVEHFDSPFYRMEKTSHRKTNDPMALGMYGISNSTSTLNASVIQLLQDLGFSSKSHWTKYLGGTPVTDSLLGIKYLIYNDVDESIIYDKIYDDEQNSLYGFYNSYALSLAYAVNESVKDISFSDENMSRSPFERMNTLVGAMLGLDDPVELFKPISKVNITYENVDYSYTSTHRKYIPSNSGKNAKIIYSFNGAGEENEIFCYFPSDYKREVDLALNGEEFGTYFANETYRIVSLGNFPQDNKILLSMTLKDNNLYIVTGVDYFYYLDTELFEEILPLLSEAQLNIESFKTTEIKGTVTAPENRTTLFTTIPYDEGWRVKVDGTKVENLKTLDALLAVEIGSGTHEIELKYSPTCFKAGLAISISGICIFAVLIVLNKRYENQKRNKHLAEYRRAFDESKGVTAPDLSDKIHTPKN